MEAEFGGSFRVLKLENVRMYDSEGNVVLCKCGKPAENAIIGKSSSMSRCNKCMNEKKEINYEI